MKEKIIAKIYETCPELKALEFGCIEKRQYRNSFDENGEPKKEINVMYLDENNVVSLHKQGLPNSDYWCFKKEILGKKPHLNHLLRTIEQSRSESDKYDVGVFTISSDGKIYGLESNGDWNLALPTYDLTKTVEQNLENEELANFIGSILFD
jgi:hypothetical protein